MNRLVAVSLLLLSGCSVTPEVVLKGERIDIFVSDTSGIDMIPRSQDDITLPISRANRLWAQKGKDGRHSGGNLSVKLPLKTSWTHSVGGGGEHSILSPPIVAERTLFLINKNQDIIALDAFDGTEIWSAAVYDDDSSDFSIGLAYHDGVVAAVTPNGFVSVHRIQDGSVLWSKELKQPVRASPTISEGRLYIMTLSNRLVAIDLETGQYLWQDSGLRLELGFLGSASPAVDNERKFVVAAYSSEEIRTMGSDNGQIFWQAQLPRGTRLGVANPMEDIIAEPIISPTRIFVLGYGGGLSALNIKDGQSLWQYPVQSSQMPWMVGNALLLITRDHQLVALNQEDGSLFWSVKLPTFANAEEKTDPLQWYGPVVVNSHAVVVSSVGNVRFYSAFSGEYKKGVFINKDIELPPIVAYQNLYLLTRHAEVIALE